MAWPIVLGSIYACWALPLHDPTSLCRPSQRPNYFHSAPPAVRTTILPRQKGPHSPYQVAWWGASITRGHGVATVCNDVWASMKLSFFSHEVTWMGYYPPSVHYHMFLIGANTNHLKTSIPCILRQGVYFKACTWKWTLSTIMFEHLSMHMGPNF